MSTYNLMSLIGSGGKQPKFFLSDVFSIVSAGSEAFSAGDTGLKLVLMAVPIPIDSGATAQLPALTFSAGSGAITFSAIAGKHTNTYRIWAMGD